MKLLKRCCCLCFLCLPLLAVSAEPPALPEKPTLPEPAVLPEPPAVAEPAPLPEATPVPDEKSPIPPDAEVIDEVPPPPKIIEGEPLDKPTITTREEKGMKIEEYRQNGVLYLIKVTPKGGGKPYYLHKQSPDAEWENVGPNPPTAVPMWKILEF